METGRKTRVWTPEQRLEQSRKLRERQIWLRSTGPRTAAGKKISSLNAVTHGHRSMPYRRHAMIFRMMMAWQRDYVRIMTNRQKTTNELIDRMRLSSPALIALGEINAQLLDRIYAKTTKIWVPPYKRHLYPPTFMTGGV